MQYIDVSNYVHPKLVLNNNFNTHMLFRCTSRKFAEDLKNGKLFLNTPGAWVEKEKTNGKGQGDALEGVFYGTDNPKGNPILKAYTNNPDIEEFEHEGCIFLRRKEILNLRCVCFYGLHDKDFIKNVDSKGRAYLQRVIPVSYFTDFYSDAVEENYDTIQRGEQPVVAFIDKPHIFFDRIRRALYKLGVEDKDIIISPVEYIQMHTHHYAALTFPRELLLKDNYFEQQSEVRLIVSTKSKLFYDYLKTHNNTIDIGTLDDIINIYDYYFRDMIIQKHSNHMTFTLPKPEFITFEEMNFSELLEQLVKLTAEEYYDLSDEEREEAIEALRDVILKKYDVNIYVSGRNFTMDRVPDEYAEQFDQLVDVENTIIRLEQNVKKALEENNIEYALQLCSNTNASASGRVLEVSNFLLVDIYRKSQRINEMLQQIEKCIQNGFKEVEVLSIRSNYYHSIGEYEKALLDLDHMQEIRGYSHMIYGNKGLSYIALKRYQEAVEVFSKAIELQGDYAFAYYNRGVAYFFLKDLENSKKDMEEAIRLQPDDDFYISEYRKCFGNRKIGEA